MKFTRLIGVTPAQLQRIQAAGPGEQDQVFQAIIAERRASRLKHFQQDVLSKVDDQLAKCLDIPPAGELPTPHLMPYLSHLIKWADIFTEALELKRPDMASLAVEMLQTSVIELTLAMMEDGAPVRRLWLGDQGDMRSGDPAMEVVEIRGKGETMEDDEPEDLDELSGIMMRIAKRAAAFKAMEAGEPFNVEDLFGGEVPSFEELPDCGQSPCPACDGRRAYFAERKVH